MFAPGRTFLMFLSGGKESKIIRFKGPLINTFVAIINGCSGSMYKGLSVVQTDLPLFPFRYGPENWLTKKQPKVAIADFRSASVVETGVEMSSIYMDNVKSFRFISVHLVNACGQLSCDGSHNDVVGCFGMEGECFAFIWRGKQTCGVKGTVQKAYLLNWSVSNGGDGMQKWNRFPGLYFAGGCIVTSYNLRQIIQNLQRHRIVKFFRFCVKFIKPVSSNMF